MRTCRLIILLLSVAGFAQATEYHVAKDGYDENPGSKQEPFLTIQRAADLAQPGDVITVHEGVYRERVNPPRGGTSDDKRIVYRAAPGEEVVIKGSEIIKGWQKIENDVWKVALPNSLFGDFNPYTCVIGGEWYRTPRDGYDRHTGAVYLNGNWLDEAPRLEDVVPSHELAAGEQAESKDTVLGGMIAEYPGEAIAGTDEDVLYHTCRWDVQGYRLAVPNGSYRVTLKFCEPHFGSNAQRVFDVRLQGKTVLKEFDILAKVAPFTAYDETFDGIKVTDGQLKIDIINRVSMGCISGIVVEGGDYCKKINCGGPDWKDYQRDPAEARILHDRPLWYAKVHENGTTIWAQFRGADPNVETVEINVRQSVFYPDKPGCNYVTVRGFTMRQAATPWSGAMSEQIGLIGTHWSKGWIIENNVISHSVNTGITLGRYDLGRFGIAMPAETAPGFVESCELALNHGWSKENIGSHVVRNNHISHCEKNGIHGSLGGVFSTIEGNTLHDIAVRGWLNGFDMSGLKLLGSVDTLIRNNHVYRCGATGGIWLDWMAQGTRVTGNLLHDNSLDLFMEVNHGPFLIDHNLFLSDHAIQDWSQGGAYAHNLIAGAVDGQKETRETPFFNPHSVENMKVSNIQYRDVRFHNNLFVGSGGLSPSDTMTENLRATGNIYLAGAQPSTQESDPLIPEDFEPGMKLEENSDGWWFEIFVDPDWRFQQRRAVVTTELLGKAKIPDAPFEQPDGTPYRLDSDYSGETRSVDNPAPGPFRLTDKKQIRLKVWPKK